MWQAELLNTILGTLSSGVAASTTSYESIASATGTGSSGTISFTSIPSTYTALQIRYIGKEDSTASAVARNIYIQFNSDTGATSYAYHELLGTGSAASAGGSPNQNAIFLGDAIATSHSSLANVVGVGIVDIQDYASTTKYKTLRTMYGCDANTASTAFQINLRSGLWMNTAAINRIDIKTSSGNYTTASTFALYGIKGA